MPKTLQMLTVLGMLGMSSICFAQQPPSSSAPPPKSTEPATTRPRPRVLTNDDFPSGSNGKTEARPSEPLSQLNHSLPTTESGSKQAALKKRARDLHERMQLHAAQMEVIKVRLDTVQKENKPVFASETKPGRTYMTVGGAGGLVLYLPVKTDEEQRLTEQLKNLEVDAQKAALEWELLLDELRRAGLTEKRALEDD
ncbi:MAG: hypothetical protein K1Y36_04185 [Blastocatellia bacterium]|nr:hypothetical protein [Blastocatellia bacterium]